MIIDQGYGQRSNNLKILQMRMSHGTL